MKKNFFIIKVSLLLMIVFLSCSKYESQKPISNDGTPPGPVSGVTVDNMSGVAKLTYKLPTDADLSYVLAVYTDKNGAVREFKTSHYENTIMLDGFATAGSYQVNLYAVDNGENKSSPVEVTVNPTTPPYLLAKASIKAVAAFGGLKTSYENPGKGTIAIVILVKNDRDQLKPFDTGYTDIVKGDFTTRGLGAKPTEVGVYVRDRWDHVSDTLFVTLTPLEETKLDKRLFRSFPLPTDAVIGYSGSVPALWNEIYDDRGYHTGEPSNMPSWFTFDLGVTAKLSRLVWWMRSGGDGDFRYQLHNPRVVEIYGSNAPASDGSWSSWTLLVKHEQIKPSGLPPGQLSQADIDAAARGENIDFDPTLSRYRYIRFKTLRNWSDGVYVNFPELSVYGQPN